MRFIQLFIATAFLFLAGAADAAQRPSSFPFSVDPVSDVELAASYGKAGPAQKNRFRMTDEVSIISLRQTASIGALLKDIWLIDFASPVIAANVRASRE